MLDWQCTRAPSGQAFGFHRTLSGRISRCARSRPTTIHCGFPQKDVGCDLHRTIAGTQRLGSRDGPSTGRQHPTNVPISWVSTLDNVLRIETPNTENLKDECRMKYSSGCVFVLQQATMRR